jgi:hypothetical protein
LYFISNRDAPFEGWVTLGSEGDATTIFNPMTGEIGVAKTRKNNGRLQVYVQLKSRETIFMKIGQVTSTMPMYRYITKVAEPLVFEGPWTITFVDGGPELPSDTITDSLSLWTSLRNSSYQSFSGCASYQTSFKKPTGPASKWILDLGRVEESAEVIINGKSLGILIGPDFNVNVDDNLLMNENILQVKVCNLMANRISYMDKQNIIWKRFYNINFPARKAENRKNNLFDASNWVPEASGLGGPVKLIPVQYLIKRNR